MAKVSIVTSVYNKGPWLRRALDSLINQTYKDLEIIIVDNASTDESVDIIDEYAAKDKRIRVVRLKKNIGPGGGYETGINNVQTEYFGLFDADDYADLNYVEVLYDKLIESNADVAMCTNDMVWDDGTVKINKRPGKDVVFTSLDIPNLLPQLLDHHSNKYLGFYLAELGVMWGKIYKTSIVKDNKINFSKDEWIFCDWLFHYKIIKQIKKLIYTEDTSYHFYQSEGSVTRSNKLNKNKKNQIKIILDKFRQEALPIDNPYLHEALTKFYFHNASTLINEYVDNYNINKDDCINAIKEIENWIEIKNIRLCDKSGLSVKERVNLFMYRYCPICFLYIRRAKKKRG